MATLPTIRKMEEFREETYEEKGKKLKKPTVRYAVAVVLKNPYAGKYVEDLTPLFPFARKLGSKLGKMIVDELGGEKNVESYGKAGVVGEDGEMENIEYIMHGGLAQGYREHVGSYEVAKEFMQATEAQGPIGTPMYIPLRCKWEWRVNYSDTFRISIPDAPRRDEMVIALAGGNGPRPLGRVPPGY